MSEPFIAEIRIGGFNFAPRGCALCNGQFLPISQNTALFSILGTTYGGNGQTTFGLPNLRGNLPMQWGIGPGLSSRVLGEESGSPTVTVLQSELPTHTHAMTASTLPASSATPGTASVPARSTGGSAYAPSGGTTLHPTALAVAGSSQPHNNMMPYLAVNFFIALEGIFPPRN